jgi:hypothetical protein
MLLEWVNGCDDMDWFQLAHRWLFGLLLLKMVMNPMIFKRREEFRPRERQSASEKRLRFMLFVMNLTVGMAECFECVTAEYSWCLICSELCVHSVCRNVQLFWSLRRYRYFAFLKSCIMCSSPKYSKTFLWSDSLLIVLLIFKTRFFLLH